MEMELFSGLVLKGEPRKSGNGQPDPWVGSSPQSWNPPKGHAQIKKRAELV